MRFIIHAVAALATITIPAIAFADTPNGLQKFMLFRSFVQDSDNCAVTVENGTPVFADRVAGAAAVTCPDAFAWSQLATAITEEWWNWGIDQTVWPAAPWPICQNGETQTCCDPSAAINPAGPQPQHCPVFRADYADISPLPAAPNGTPSMGVINHSGLQLADEIDPGRLLRDLELELVFRNKPMVQYIYDNDLYSKEGLGARNRAQNAAISAGDIGAAHRLKVRFPVDATMVKADFIHQDIMLAQKLIQTTDANGAPLDPPQNPDYPYLTVQIDGNGGQDQVPGLYYMVAMTNASKDLPIWHWYAMEHVANLGRCDYIGCNDSYGYTVNGAAQAGADFGETYIPPMIDLNNDKTDDNDPLFVTGLTYLPKDTGETITPELAALFKAMGVGTAATDPDYKTITADDPAWLNYRLKGTQTSFTTPTGIPTGMGATVTEGGFVNSASCTTCHSQASVNADGASGFQGVGSTFRPNLLGYNQVEMGAPNSNWFYAMGSPSITATQIDFVWGILNASCVNPVAGSRACAFYPDAPASSDY